jgi:hypothetical protein
VTDPVSGNVITPPGFSSANLGGATYSSFVNGKTLPGAWQVELDIPVIDAATSQGFSYVRVFGISLQEVMQSNDLTGKNIAVYGGMQKGLPLANPAQAGLLVSGNVFQCFGNWQGPVMTLDFVIAPGPAMGSNPGGVGTLAKPRNLTLNWQGGQPLGPALQSALQTGFPGFTVPTPQISSSIVRPAGDTPSGFYSTLEQLAQAVRAISKSIVKTSGYAGISIVPNGSTINVFDGTQQSSNNSVAIAFQDLIGQPTWIESPNISFKTVMRADLSVGQQVTLPKTIITNTSQASSSLVNQKATFQGGFTVVSERHVGDYRAASSEAWVSVFEAAPNNLVAA